MYVWAKIPMIPTWPGYNVSEKDPIPNGFWKIKFFPDGACWLKR